MDEASREARLILFKEAAQARGEVDEVETATIVTILPDRGDEYLSTDLFRI